MDSSKTIEQCARKRYAKVSCAGCNTVFRWRNIKLLAQRISEHRCWEVKQEE